LEYCTAIWYNLWPFVIVSGLLIHFSQFGMFGSRKIWQPWLHYPSGFLDFYGRESFFARPLFATFGQRKDPPFAQDFRKSGPMLWFFKYFRRKKIAKKLALLTDNKAKLCKILIITLGFYKNANFFAKNGRKVPKIVIITSTPDWENFRPMGGCLLWVVLWILQK
jgi:hypothetical protein